MKRLCCIFTACIALAGCGGGGGTPSTPAPTAPPIANTSLPYYLPMSSGNTWTFASGGKLVDMGPMQIACACPANGSMMERIGLYSPGAQTLGASFFFAKHTPSGATQITSLIGDENDANTNNITLMSDTAFPYGIPVMDDSPALNESWNDGAGDASTITAVGGTMMLPDSSEIIDVATDRITGNFSAITWGFAKGVGFTSIGVGTQSTALASFTISTASSFVRTTGVAQIAHATVGKVHAAAILSTLFR
ncbi:MAG TPA: hypothetical protein VJP85_06275 [Candidatus Baltobacteraceae bacterium]|nr:hypothetical protein [Candidatus Baltobacteraceae bacterium]